MGRSAKGLLEAVQEVCTGTDCRSDMAALQERRNWALDQLLALCRNGSVPKNDSWITVVLEFLLVHGFFIIRKADKKSNIASVSPGQDRLRDIR
jgi:hypothetical protein